MWKTIFVLALFLSALYGLIASFDTRAADLVRFERDVGPSAAVVPAPEPPAPVALDRSGDIDLRKLDQAMALRRVADR